MDVVVVSLLVFNTVLVVVSMATVVVIVLSVPIVCVGGRHMT